MLQQPDEATCGPTCLHAVFRYWGDDEALDSVIGRAERLEHGGTLAVFLACDAASVDHDMCLGWSEFSDADLVRFYKNWFSEEITIATSQPESEATEG